MHLRRPCEVRDPLGPGCRAGSDCRLVYGLWRDVLLAVSVQRLGEGRLVPSCLGSC